MFAAAGHGLLERTPTEDYRQEWRDVLASPLPEEAADTHPWLLFRLGGEHLALPAGVCREVTPLRPVHRIPHQHARLRGLVNIRGRLWLCASLQALLDVPEETPARQFIVFEQGADRWVFPVAAVEDVVRIPHEALRLVPAGHATTLARFATHFFPHPDATQTRVACLDPTRLVDALNNEVLA